MSSTKFLLIAIATLGFGDAVSADTKPEKLDTKKLSSTPAPELAALSKFFVGSWHCEGSTTPVPGVGKTFASKNNTTWALALDGFWIGGTTEGEKVPGMPLPTVFKGESRLTYDRVAKQYVNFAVGNRGGFTSVTSKGWEGDKLIWAGSASGVIKTETRSTITKKGDKEFKVVGERMEDGKWVVGADETCKKK